MLSVLCEPAKVESLADIIFHETSAFGVRTEQVVRLKLERRFEKVPTEFGEVIVKLGLKNGEVVQVAPEFESCRTVSEKCGQPVRIVYEAATRAFRQRRS
jgi:hypothetical protein